MSKDKTDETTVGWDAIVGDVFGINLRGFKTIWQSFKSPKNFYDASYNKDWRNRYTPSFRLWFTLLAMTYLFQFFWAGTNSGAFEYTAEAYKASGTLPSHISPHKAAKEYLGWTYGYMPIISTLCLFLLAGIYRIWGEKLNFPMRLRKTFITIIPSSFLGIFLVPCLGFVSASRFFTFIAFLYGIALLLDVLTAYRGAFRNHSIKGRLWRALALGAAIMLTSIVAGFLSNIAASATIYVKYVVLIS